MDYDPREELARLAGELVNAAYEEEVLGEEVEDLVDLMHEDHDAAARLIQSSKDAGEKIVGVMRLLGVTAKRQSILRQYVTLRKTIEAMEKPRVEIPEEPK